MADHHDELLQEQAPQAIHGSGASRVRIAAVAKHVFGRERPVEAATSGVTDEPSTTACNAAGGSAENAGSFVL